MNRKEQPPPEIEAEARRLTKEYLATIPDVDNGDDDGEALYDYIYSHASEKTRTYMDEHK